MDEQSDDPRERRGYERRRTDRLRSETLDHLVRGVAHDLNNVLGVLLAQIDRVERSVDGDQELRSAIDALHASVAHGESLSEAISMLGRDRALEHDLVDVNELIASTVELVASAIPHEVRLTVALHARPAQVVVLAGSVERVLLNATLNAVRAMPAGGSLTIATRTECRPDGRDEVVIEVIDDGIGVDEHARRRAFDPGFTTRRSPAGHGVGLAGSRQLVTATGGSLELAGTPGHGSTLTLRYPAADALAPARRRRADDAASDHRDQRDAPDRAGTR